MGDEELNRKLAEWASISRNGAIYGDREAVRDWQLDFTSSLDACFKWLVPKLKTLVLWKSAEHWAIEVSGNGVIHHASAKIPALALCKAIEQLIKEKQ